MKSKEKIILHSDMNNFYASVECMLNPELRDKYVAVCGRQKDRHGIVLAKNEKAKALGVATGEPVWQALRKCPMLVTVDPHFDIYMKYSKLAREIYYRYTDLIEPFGLDECFLALHHAGTCHLTKLFDHRSADLCHDNSSLIH